MGGLKSPVCLISDRNDREEKSDCDTGAACWKSVLSIRLVNGEVSV